MARGCFLGQDVSILEPRFPITHGVVRNGERDGYDLARPARTAPHTGPREKSNNCPWSARTVAKIEMIASWIVEINGALDQSQAEHLRIKIQIALRVTGDRGNMMNAVQFHFVIRRQVTGKIN